MGAATYIIDAVIAGDAAVVAAHAMQTEQAEVSFYAFGVGCAVNRYGMPPTGRMLARVVCCCLLLPNLLACPIYQDARCWGGNAADFFCSDSYPEARQLLCRPPIIQAFFDQVAVNTFAAGLNWTE